MSLNNFSDNTTSPKRWYHHWWLWLLTLVVFWFAVPWILSWLWPQSQITGNGFTARPGQSEVNAPAVVDVVTKTDPSLGPIDAPVTIVEFGDFQCPFCRASASVIRQVVRQNQEAVRLIYRDFPVLEIHDQAVVSAEAAACASAQGKFWEYHDLLFAGQDKLSDLFYKELATSLKLNLTTFEACRAGHTYLSKISENLKAGVTAGVHGTPTWFVNGRKIEGVLSQSEWQSIINAAIKDKFKKK